jgi:hypothetical protein
MSENNQPANKAALLDTIQNERARLESLLEGLTETQMIELGVEGDWSIKDILAHIAAWERLAMDRIHAAQTGSDLKYPLIAGDDFVDQFNAQTYEAHKDQPLSEVQDEFHSTHRDFLAQIEALAEEKLPQKLNFDWSGKLTHQVMISANTHWHYPDHAAAIEKWLENQDR